MPKLRIASGTKLDLQLIGLEHGKKLYLKSTFEKNVDEDCFLISAPIHKEEYVIFEPLAKLVIRYVQGNIIRILTGCVDEHIKIGVRNYWKIHMLSEERQFVKRSHERTNISLRISFNKANILSNDPYKKEKMYAIGKDISYGGIALKINDLLETNDVIEINLPLVGRMKITQKAQTRWITATEKDKSFSYLAGFRFVFTTAEEKENMKAYVGALMAIRK